MLNRSEAEEMSHLLDELCQILVKPCMHSHFSPEVSVTFAVFLAKLRSEFAALHVLTWEHRSTSACYMVARAIFEGALDFALLSSGSPEEVSRKTAQFWAYALVEDEKLRQTRDKMSAIHEEGKPLNADAPVSRKQALEVVRCQALERDERSEWYQHLVDVLDSWHADKVQGLSWSGLDTRTRLKKHEFRTLSTRNNFVSAFHSLYHVSSGFVHSIGALNFLTDENSMFNDENGTWHLGLVSGRLGDSHFIPYPLSLIIMGGFFAEYDAAIGSPLSESVSHFHKRLDEIVR